MWASQNWLLPGNVIEGLADFAPDTASASHDPATVRCYRSGTLNTSSTFLHTTLSPSNSIIFPSADTSHQHEGKLNHRSHRAARLGIGLGAQDEAEEGPSFRAACKLPPTLLRPSHGHGLTRQQEAANIGDHMQALGQKYMGVRPQKHADEMFKETSFHPESGHPVAVSNFLNAQCKSRTLRSFHRGHL